MSTNLGATQLSGGMANPETAVNSATGRLDAAMTESMTLDLSNDLTLTTTNFQSAYKFNITPVTAGKKLTLPAVKRLALFDNQDSADAVIIKRGTTEISLPAGRIGLFFIDATTNGLLQIKLLASPTHFYTAAGAPGSVSGAVDGDFYVNSTNGLLYQLGLSSPGVWASTSITIGTPSAAGAPHWYSGAGAPGTVTGSVDGDMYYDTTSGALYQKGLLSAGVWDATGVTLGTGGGGGSAVDFHPPTTSLFTYAAASSGATCSVTYDAARGYSIARTDASSGGEHAIFQGKAVPAGSSWTAKMKFRSRPTSSNDVHRNLFSLYESATGKWLGIGVVYSNTGTYIQVIRSTSLTSFGTNVVFAQLVLGTIPQFMALVWNGTSYDLKFSFDFGVTYETYATVAATTAFTTAADKVGILLMNTGGFTLKQGVLIEYYVDPDFP